MRVLVKVGGTLLEDDETRDTIARQLAAVSRIAELVVVHGGGKQVTEFLERQGVPTLFVDGLRVSDEKVIDGVTKVIAGAVNKALVSALLRAGVAAVGLSGIDGRLTSAVQLSPDLGFVGKPVSTNPDLFHVLRSAGYIPVIACIAAGADGTVFNVNADEMGVSCAVAYGADRLIFLTDVPGVRGPTGEIFAQLARSEARELMHSGVAQGGMRAKLRAALAGLEQGIPQVHIVSGREPDGCVRLLGGNPFGTRLAIDNQDRTHT